MTATVPLMAVPVKVDVQCFISSHFLSLSLFQWALSGDVRRQLFSAQFVSGYSKKCLQKVRYSSYMHVCLVRK